MPGPRATNRKRQAPAPNSPNRKTVAAMKRRVDGFTEKNLQNGQQMHKPGSQNRKKF